MEQLYRKVEEDGWYVTCAKFYHALEDDDDEYRSDGSVDVWFKDLTSAQQFYIEHRGCTIERAASVGYVNNATSPHRSVRTNYVPVDMSKLTEVK